MTEIGRGSRGVSSEKLGEPFRAVLGAMSRGSQGPARETPNLQEFGSFCPYKAISTSGQSTAGGVACLPKTSAKKETGVLAASGIFCACALPAFQDTALSPQRMNSNQFNKGPSYGLSAEVRNRVSGP